MKEMLIGGLIAFVLVGSFIILMEWSDIRDWLRKLFRMKSKWD